LGEACKNITKGTTPTTYGFSYTNDGVNFIKIESIDEFGNFITEKLEHIDKHTNDYLSRSKLEEGDILFSIAGALGRVAIVKKLILPANVNQALAIIRLKEKEESTISFLKFYLSSFLIRNYIENILVRSAQSNLTLKHIENFLIPLPPLPEQQKIAEILETIDSAIEKTDKIIEKYKRIKQGLMQDLLTKGIDENGNIRDEKTHKFKDSPLGRIPEEWEVVRLGEISLLKGRIGWQGLTTQEYLEDGEYYLITGVNFENSKIEWESCFYVSEKRYNMDKNIQLKPEDVLVTKDGTIGKVAYIDKLPKKATLGTGIFLVRSISNVYYPKYLYHVFTSFVFDKFIDNLKAGSTINHLYQKDFVLFKIPLPPIPEQERIATILSQIDEVIEKEQAYKEKLERIKKGLMEDLLTGKVRVNHLIEEEDKDGN
jgi:type I restriction enzyme S subunit